MSPFREERLANGLLLLFADESNRYFGDYHRVCVTATLLCRLAGLPAATADQAELRRQALALFGEQLTVVRRFERMGVATAEVDAVRMALVDDFLTHAGPYLARPGYPGALVASELKRRRSCRPYA